MPFWHLFNNYKVKGGEKGKSLVHLVALI